MRPGIVAELRAGIAADRAALQADGRLSPELAAVTSEALRMLDLGSAR